VTGFNGGNCNPVTGDFSYGVEGFAFSKGKVTHPVKEMLITGSLSLPNHHHQEPELLLENNCRAPSMTLMQARVDFSFYSTVFS
ncbi:MAG: hypothetical protein IIX35_03875, partial [Paraprevotella sp.]|nr:hypothetical protein [Paraprevotella sp.]